MSPDSKSLALGDFEAAQLIVAKVAVNTPLLASNYLSEITGQPTSCVGLTT
jgi:threonine dehydratase